MILYREHGVSLWEIRQDILHKTPDLPNFRAMAHGMNEASKRLAGSVTNQHHREYSRNLISIFIIN